MVPCAPPATCEEISCAAALPRLPSVRSSSGVQVVAVRRSDREATWAPGAQQDRRLRRSGVFVVDVPVTEGSSLPERRPHEESRENLRDQRWAPQFGARAPAEGWLGGVPPWNPCVRPGRFPRPAQAASGRGPRLPLWEREFSQGLEASDQNVCSAAWPRPIYGSMLRVPERPTAIAYPSRLVQRIELRVKRHRRTESSPCTLAVPP